MDTTAPQPTRTQTQVRVVPTFSHNLCTLHNKIGRYLLDLNQLPDAVNRSQTRSLPLDQLPMPF